MLPVFCHFITLVPRSWFLIQVDIGEFRGVEYVDFNNRAGDSFSHSWDCALILSVVPSGFNLLTLSAGSTRGLILTSRQTFRAFFSNNILFHSHPDEVSNVPNFQIFNERLYCWSWVIWVSYNIYIYIFRVPYIRYICIYIYTCK